MPTDYILSQLKDLAQRLNDGEILKISSKTVSLIRWGRIKSLGFNGTAAMLGQPVERRVRPDETPRP